MEKNNEGAQSTKPEQPVSTPVLVAKMHLGSRAETFTGDEATGEQLELYAVSGGSEMNKQWSQWTPSGSLKLHITNPDALGKVYRGYYKVMLVPCGKDD